MTCDTVFLVGGPRDGEWLQLEPGCFSFPVAIHQNRYGQYRRPTLFANTMTWEGPEVV